MMLFPMTLNDP